ncbi:MAG: hypothetical protein U1B78_01240, partial [Dehalococcoidia bacterium]|nr:hypothetical protein [Dehalococcoidia bacterium]
MLLGVGLFSCFQGGGDDGVPLPELTPFDEELAERLEEIADDAADIRGLDLYDDIEQGTLTREQLKKYSEEWADHLLEDDEFNFDAFNIAFRMLGMIGPEDDLLEISTTFQGSQVAGFYSYEDRSLVLVTDDAEDLSGYDETVLAHEYVHSFQDGAFDLQELMKLADEEEEDKANTEYSDTLSALIEGDAEYAQMEYTLKAIDEDDFDAFDIPASEPGDDEPIPPAFQRYFSFPYTYGSDFVSYLYDEGGWDEVDEAYEDPPSTEEQIMHPEKYLSDEDAVGISMPDFSDDLGDGWNQEADDVFGEFDVYNWLLSVLDEDGVAELGAEGWGGGRLAVYGNEEEEERAVIHMALFWDNTMEARQFYTAFADVVRSIDGEPDILDPSAQIVAWVGAGQGGQA